jgi:hypothetical protein
MFKLNFSKIFPSCIFQKQKEIFPGYWSTKFWLEFLNLARSFKVKNGILRMCLRHRRYKRCWRTLPILRAQAGLLVIKEVATKGCDVAGGYCPTLVACSSDLGYCWYGYEWQEQWLRMTRTMVAHSSDLGYCWYGYEWQEQWCQGGCHT